MKRFLRLFLVAATVFGASVIVARAEEPAAIQQRMQSRLSTVDSLKQRQAVGETNRGLLQVRGTLSGDEAALVAAENADRAAIYAELARRTGSQPDDVARTRARKIAAGSASGIWLEDESGRWYQK